MLKGATDPNAKAGFCPEWDNLNDYLKYGYLGPDTIRWHNRPSGPSQTLEFTTTDFSIAQLGPRDRRQQHLQDVHEKGAILEEHFRHQTGYVEPRRKDGSFIQVDPAKRRYTWIGKKLVRGRQSPRNTVGWFLTT